MGYRMRAGHSVGGDGGLIAGQRAHNACEEVGVVACVRDHAAVDPHERRAIVSWPGAQRVGRLASATNDAKTGALVLLLVWLVCCCVGRHWIHGGGWEPQA